MDENVKENIKEYLEFLLNEALIHKCEHLVEDIKLGLEQLEKTGILIPF